MNIKQNIPLPPEGYKPTENEPYMNHVMLAYFEQKLFSWKNELLQESHDIGQSIKTSSTRSPDFLDAGLIEEARETEYILAKNDLELMQEVDRAIERINSGNYGYCEKTGEEIGIRRLDAWPIATSIVKRENIS